MFRPASRLLAHDLSSVTCALQTRPPRFPCGANECTGVRITCAEAIAVVHETKNSFGFDFVTKLNKKIKTALDESRILVLGTQILLGFQFRAFFEKSFDTMTGQSRYLLLAGRFLLLASIGLMMWPGSYHRIVERGEETDHFHAVASTLLLAAMVLLPLGICGELYGVLQRIPMLQDAALNGALVTLAFFYTLWFGVTSFKRMRLKANRDRND